MKKSLIWLLSSALVFAGCATSQKEAPLILEQIIEKYIKPAPILNFSEENRYHWTSESHKEGSVIYYNPSIATLDYGLRNKDLLVVLKNDDDYIIAEEARVKNYRVLKKFGFVYQSTIEFRLDDGWHETSPSDSEYNINLNTGNLGGIYKVRDIVHWPEDPFDALFFKYKKDQE